MRERGIDKERDGHRRKKESNANISFMAMPSIDTVETTEKCRLISFLYPILLVEECFAFYSLPIFSVSLWEIRFYTFLDDWVHSKCGFVSFCFVWYARFFSNRFSKCTETIFVHYWALLFSAIYTNACTKQHAERERHNTKCQSMW